MVRPWEMSSTCIDCKRLSARVQADMLMLLTGKPYSPGQAVVPFLGSTKDDSGSGDGELPGKHASHSLEVGSMSDQRRRRWADTDPTLRNVSCLLGLHVQSMSHMGMHMMKDGQLVGHVQNLKFNLTLAKF